MNFLYKLFKILLLLTLIPFVLGFLQAMHPLFDSFSHFRYHLLIAIIIQLALLTIFNKKTAILLLLSISYWYLFPLTYTEINATKPMPGLEFTHMQFNLSFRNSKLDSVLELLKSKKPDIVTMQEVTDAHRAKLESLKDSIYPYQTYCEFYPVVGGVAILSKHPISNTTCAKRLGLVKADIDINGTTISTIAMHLHWPYPSYQYQQVNELMPIFKDLKKSKYRLISGDFNAAPWSNIVKIIAKASNTKIVSGLRWTIALDGQLPYMPFAIKLPIDQLLLHGMYSKKSVVLKHYGSDHYPVFSTIKLWTNRHLPTR